MGLKYSVDGTTLLIGCRIGAIKLIFPLLVLNPTSAQKAVAKKDPSKNASDYETSEGDNLGDNTSVLIGYIISQSILGWLNRRRQRKKVEEWRQNSLKDLLKKQEATIRLI